MFFLICFSGYEGTDIFQNLYYARIIKFVKTLKKNSKPHINNSIFVPACQKGRFQAIISVKKLRNRYEDDSV